MSRGEAYRHIRLLDATGKPVEDPFLELDEELWSGDGRRFTLLFDPGRIKRGLKPREEVGPGPGGGQVLRAGRRRAAGPTPTAIRSRAGFRKAFRTGSADETSPDPKTWDVRPPAAGTRDAAGGPLPRAARPGDARSADRRPGCGRDRRGRRVSVADEETLWRFTPARPVAGGRLSPGHRHRARGPVGQQRRPAVRG